MLDNSKTFCDLKCLCGQYNTVSWETFYPASYGWIGPAVNRSFDRYCLWVFCRAMEHLLLPTDPALQIKENSAKILKISSP